MPSYRFFLLFFVTMVILWWSCLIAASKYTIQKKIQLNTDHNISGIPNKIKYLSDLSKYELQMYLPIYKFIKIKSEWKKNQLESYIWWNWWRYTMPWLVSLSLHHQKCQSAKQKDHQKSRIQFLSILLMKLLLTIPYIKVQWNHVLLTALKSLKDNVG